VFRDDFFQKSNVYEALSDESFKNNANEAFIALHNRFIIYYNKNSSEPI
jgi:hypothetical protein